jgi:hypothetical protein
MDELDLKMNNITNLKTIFSNQIFKQDNYKIKNSPINYYYGSNNSLFNLSYHTYMDLRQNKFFKFDCKSITDLRKLAKIQLLHESMDDYEFNSKCSFEDKKTIENLSKKFQLFLSTIFIILVVLTSILIYYMFFDCSNNYNPLERIRFLAREFLMRFKLKNFDLDDNNTSSQYRQPNSNTKIIYSKLDNDIVNLDI